MNGFIQLIGMKHETYLVLRWNAADGFVQNLLKYFVQAFVQTCNFNVGKHSCKLNTITRGIRFKLFRVHLPSALDVKGSFVVALVAFATTHLRGGWLFAHHIIVRAFLATARLRSSLMRSGGFFVHHFIIRSFLAMVNLVKNFVVLPIA